MRGTRAFVLAGIAAALLVGAGLSYLASGDPDGLESAIVKTQCADAADPDACLEEAAGEAAYTGAPQGLADYEVGWLSGIVGVVVTFLVGAGIVAVVRRRSPANGARSPTGS